MATTTTITRSGTEPNRSGREAVAGAMRRLLEDGERFTASDSNLSPDELRSWAARLRELALDLADCVEAPARNRVMELLESVSLPDNMNAVWALRENVAGASPGQLASEVDVAGRTIERIEDGEGCQPRVAKSVADRFALSVSELFGHGTRGDALRARTVGELRAMMQTPQDELGLRG